MRVEEFGRFVEHEMIELLDEIGIALRPIDDKHTMVWAWWLGMASLKRRFGKSPSLSFRVSLLCGNDKFVAYYRGYGIVV